VPKDLPEWFIEKAKAITAKRAKTVITHILEHGHITTEELRTLYGYDHPPRAARDVREQGIPLESFRIPNTQGKSIGAYRFADPSLIRADILSGRKVFSKHFKQLLIERSGARCGICLTEYESRYLQVDHKVPYEVAGEGSGEIAPNEFQLVCGSCNRAKSWSCEHCRNWTTDKQVKVCKNCYWANPDSYSHLAMRAIRRLEIVWTEKEVGQYDRLAKAARKQDQALPEFVKTALRRRGS
jgi:5-methylcytosine-specific restriction endonuclease McrA